MILLLLQRILTKRILNIQQKSYVYNDSYKDEWILQSANYVLPTPLLPQKTNSWCWAASAEMLARTKHPTAANNDDANTILQEQRDAVYHHLLIFNYNKFL